jgi:surface antigen
LTDIMGKIRSSRSAVIALGLAVPLLSACTTTAPSLMGKSLFSKAPPSPSARILASLQGGVVGKAGADLSDNDQKRALEAEYRTLEAAPSGQPVIWRGEDANGEVIAAAPFQVGTQNCRQISHRVIADGKQLQARGSACRNNDGSWSLLN